MKRYIHFFIILTIVTSFYSCKNEEVNPKDPTGIEFSTAPFDLDGINAKFAKDIAYDDKERTKLDIFLPESSTPTPLVIYIHGGGYKTGDKSHPYAVQFGLDFPSRVKALLSNKVAFASINYSFLKNKGEEKEGVIKCLNDAKRALQYIRSRANDFNIDKEKIALTGVSAGAGSSLWIATRDEMADPNNADNVLRESTRVKAIALLETQATYNLDKWKSDIFVDYNLSWDDFFKLSEDDISSLYGIDSMSEYNSEKINKYKSNVDMLAQMTSDDPEIWADNRSFLVVSPTINKNIAYHHAYHVREIKEKADEVGIPNVCYYGNPVIFSDPSKESLVDFLLRNLK